MYLKKIIVLFLLLLSTLGFSQETVLSPISKISLLTIGTAGELHSKFGHTAIRIQDASTSMDIVFGYGGFDFDDPLFYYKFTTGKLDYAMTGHRYNNFIASYKIENRSVKEQSLNLTTEQRNTLFAFLKNNFKEENRYYKYDFLFNNCATKIPEVFNSIFKDRLKFDYSHLEKEATFRQLIHQTLDTNSWAAFGIDLALGSVIDRKATPSEFQFLPIYVNKQLANTQLDGVDLVLKENLLLDVKPISENKNLALSPIFWLCLLPLTVAGLTYFDYKKDKRSRWLDFTLFFTTGFAGIIIAFLWFATDHSSTKINFNVFWAFAPNLIAAFYLVKKQLPLWTKKYLWLTMLLLLTTVVFWLFKIQVFSPLLIFILITLSIRYLFLLYCFKRQKSGTIQ